MLFRSYDIGDKEDYLHTILAFALRRDEFAKTIRALISSLADSGDTE